MIGVPQHVAVIHVWGEYNVVHNMTYAKAQKLRSKHATLYRIVKYANGYEILERQQQGAMVEDSITFFNRLYIKKLSVLIPDQPYYQNIARRVLRSYHPLG